MSHPSRMLTNTELGNFARFIRHPNPEGAFDSALPKSSKPAHIARLRKGVPLREFGPGGAYDSSPENDLSAPDRAVLVALAQKLTDEEWMALKNSLCSGSEGAVAEDTEGPDEERPAPAMDQFTSRTRQDPYRRDNRPAAPASQEGAASFHALYPEAVLRTV